jgi:hypothetical protein
MSESEGTYTAPWVSKRYHDFGHRTRDEILLAYLSCFSSPAGQIVMDDLYQSICGRQMMGERDIGRHDFWIYILEALQEAERLLRQVEGRE